MSFEETHNAPTTQTQEAAPEQPETQTAEQPPNEHAAQPQTAPAPLETSTAPAAAPRSEKEPTMEDFASALESFEQEQAQTEAALNEDQIVTARC